MSRRVEVVDSQYLTLTKATAQARYPCSARKIRQLARYLEREGIPIIEVSAGYRHFPSGLPACSYFVNRDDMEKFESALQKNPHLKEDMAGNGSSPLGNMTLRRR
jgi:hypothetical protein